MCNAKHLLTTALNVLKMIKQEGNFSQQALTDGFSNNELTFGAAWGWERESCTGSGSRFGAENSGRVTFVTAELWPLQGAFLAWGRHALVIYLATATGTGSGMGRCGGPWTSHFQNSAWSLFLIPWDPLTRSVRMLSRAVMKKERRSSTQRGRED